MLAGQVELGSGTRLVLVIESWFGWDVGHLYARFSILHSHLLSWGDFLLLLDDSLDFDRN